VLPGDQHGRKTDECRRGIHRRARFPAAPSRGLRHGLSRFPLAKGGSLQLALDYFDRMAEGNARPALWIVNEDGTEFKASFAEMRVRANRAANFLRALGVKRGDRILLMLGNVPPLWEVMLAPWKLGPSSSPRPRFSIARTCSTVSRAGA